MTKRATLERDSAMAAEEAAFLAKARRKFKENVDWLDFEDFAFGMRSPLFGKARSQQDILRHPLYLALKEMWIDLGIRQGKMKDASRGRQNGSR